MTLNPRQSALIEMVRAQGSASIEELAKRFDVTLQTVRRDVNILSEAGLLSRFHGGVRIEASTIENIAYRKRQGLHAAGKQRIAEAVARAVPDGCSLILNIGTTTEAIARALLRHRGLRVITNNLHVADILSDNPDCEVIVAGGVVRSRDRGIVGEATMDFIRQFKVDIGLIGISGIEADGTLRDYDFREVRVARTIIDQSREVWLAADSSKFKRQAMVELAHISQIDRFFTDAHPQEPLAQVLLDSGVRCEVAAAPNAVKNTPDPGRENAGESASFTPARHETPKPLPRGAAATMHMNQPLASVTPPDRNRLLATLDNTPSWDVIVIGGGATGLGTAVDAASRGYRTLLIEGADFAKGTSSKATKLVHGGVRYLAQGNVSLVREALHERGLLNRNAPHLVWPLGFVVPAYNLFDQPFYGIGLKMYDMLAGKLNLAPSRWLSRRDTLANAPTLAENVNGRGLKGGVLYYDGQFDDARLAVSLMRTLFDLGGTAVNYVRATGLTTTGGKVDGVTAEDGVGGAQFTLRANCVINATGVWVDSVRRMEDKNAQTMVAPSQGVHLTLPQDFLPGKRAILIPKTDDGRVLFVVPWNGHTIVGTTDTPRNDLPLDPEAGAQDVDFILSTAARYLSRKPTRDDVTSVWAGLRPLVKATGDAATKQLSREHTILVSKAGLVTVTGGKWTTYRRMAQDVVDTAIQHQLLTQASCRTESLPLHGAAGLAPSQEHAGTPDSYYGSDLATLKSLPGADRMLIKASGLSEAHVRFAARFELARSAEDVLARRNRALFLDSEAAMLAAPEVARILAEELGHDAAWQQRTLQDLSAVAAHYRLK